MIISAFLLNPTLAMSWPGNGVAPATPDDKICQQPPPDIGTLVVRGDFDDSARPILDEAIADGYPGGPIDGIGNRLNISDAIRLLEYLYLGGNPPKYMEAADANTDGKIDISDPKFILNYLFLGGPAPNPVLVVTKKWDATFDYFPFGTYLTTIENANNASIVVTADGRQWRPFKVSYRRIGGPEDPEGLEQTPPFVIEILGPSKNIYSYGYYPFHTVCDPDVPDGTAHTFSFFLPEGSFAIVGMFGDSETSTTAQPTILTYAGYKVLRENNVISQTPDGGGGCVNCNGNNGGVEVHSIPRPDDLCADPPPIDWKKELVKKLGNPDSEPQHCPLPDPPPDWLTNAQKALDSVANAVPGLHVSFGTDGNGNPWCGLGLDGQGAAMAAGAVAVGTYEACKCSFYACKDVANFLADQGKKGIDKAVDAIIDAVDAVQDLIAETGFFQ